MNKQKWILVQDQLPDDETPVLALYDGRVEILELCWEYPGFEDTYEAFRYWDRPYDGGRGDIDSSYVTCWMPLPEVGQCCPNEDRDFNGGCKVCGDPCF